MRFRYCLVATLMASLTSVARAQVVADAPLVRGTLAFDAHATLGAFTGVTNTMTGHVDASNSLSAVHGWVEAPANSLTTHNGHRDSDMAGSLEITKYPTIRFDLDSVAPGDTRGDSIAVILKGRLTIHGQTRAVSIPGNAWVTGSSAKFRGALPISVKDYGVGGLSKMLGVLKMNEMIVVRIDVEFSK